MYCLEEGAGGAKGFFGGQAYRSLVKQEGENVDSSTLIRLLYWALSGTYGATCNDSFKIAGNITNLYIMHLI